MIYTVPQIKSAVESILPEIIEIRHFLHQNPELSEEESNTQEYICKILDSYNISYVKTEVGYGVCATIYGKNQTRGIGIRADIDALPVTEAVDVPFKSQNPGVMHACGHDIHTAILLGTAKLLKEKENSLPYCVRLFFQPAEETIGGADQMIKEDFMSNPTIENVISLHVEPSLETGKVAIYQGAMNAAATDFHVTVVGKGCHGAHPDQGIDPLIPACEMVSSLQSIITRKFDPAQPTLITVGSFHSGNKSNIIPDETYFTGILRALSDENLERLKTELRSHCTHIASAHGAKCSIEIGSSYPVLINDIPLGNHLAKGFCELLGEENVTVSVNPSLGADDFAFFATKCPSCYYVLGVAEPGKTCYPLHSEKFNPDEECIKYGIMTQLSAVLSIFN